VRRGEGRADQGPRVGEAKPKGKRRERPGPPSQLDRALERVRGLPRGEQQRIVELIDDAVARAERRLAT